MSLDLDDADYDFSGDTGNSGLQLRSRPQQASNPWRTTPSLTREWQRTRNRLRHRPASRLVCRCPAAIDMAAHRCDAGRAGFDFGLGG